MCEIGGEAQEWAQVSVVHIKEKSFKGRIKYPSGQVGRVPESNVPMYSVIGGLSFVVIHLRKKFTFFWHISLLFRLSFLFFFPSFLTEVCN